MDVCKCIVPSWHRDVLNSCRAESPLVRLVEGEERWDATDHPKGLPSKLEWKRAKSDCHLNDAQSYG
ncbi:hypothetical protein TNCV_1437801 [Trichonephila clavipes]|nr:hypothetical protein TNCV_1437801 [Trichonephila clavipes]